MCENKDHVSYLFRKKKYNNGSLPRSNHILTSQLVRIALKRAVMRCQFEEPIIRHSERHQKCLSTICEIGNSG